MANKKENYISRAKTSAVYRGADVSTFAHDLSNYSQLRRGLSPEMRAQTMTKTQLKNASPETVERYINALNAWREAPQELKARRSGRGREPVERVFMEAAKLDMFTSDEKAKLFTANLKLKTMSKSEARMKISEGLNQVDRLRNQDFYEAKYYLDNGNFDPQLATDDMLRAVISSGYIYQYEDQQQAVIDEYLSRMGGGAAAEAALASSRMSYAQDILGLAVTMI